MLIIETGNKYGKLEVIGQAPSNNGACWLCLCKCGNTTVVRGGNLRSNSTTTCGCDNKGYSKGVLGRSRVYDVNDEAFHRVTQFSCYWAGFIAADGNIHSRRPVLIVDLANKDFEHLEKLKEFIKCTNPIKTTASKVRDSLFWHSRLYVTSDQIVKDLYKHFLITPRKSLTLQYPKFKSVNYEDCYIVGYIDGDGYIKMGSKSRIEIIGTKSVLQGIRNRFSVLLSQKQSIKIIKINQRGTFRLIIYGDNARILFNHYSKLALPKLDRKWNSLDKQQKYDIVNA
jgi:hypothetical protein